MPSNKPKLLPFSKRTFLEVGLKYVVDKQGLASEKQAKSWMYMFVKMLCISKSYLYLCRRTTPDIYRLNLNFAQNPGSIKVSLASKNYNFSGENHAFLTYNSVCKLINLLLPSYVGASFDHSSINAAVFEKYLEILKLTEDTKGKIGLNLCKGLEKKFVQTLLETLATRTYVLYCLMNQFETVESLQFPTFDCLSVQPIVTLEQSIRVLKCKAKKLKLHFNNSYFTINDNDLVDLKNETITNLHLDFEQINYSKVENLGKQLHKPCLNLKHFDIKAAFFPAQVVSVNRIPDQVVAYSNRMNDLKACIGNVHAHIYFHVSFYLNGRRDNTWINLISDKPEFKHWEFKSNVIDCGGFFGFHDVLKMKFNNAGCKFEMSIDV